MLFAHYYSIIRAPLAHYRTRPLNNTGDRLSPSCCIRYRHCNIHGTFWRAKNHNRRFSVSFGKGAARVRMSQADQAHQSDGKLDTSSQTDIHSSETFVAALDHDDIHLDFNLQTGSWSAQLGREGVTIRSGTACEVYGGGGGKVLWPLKGSTPWAEEFRGDVLVENLGEYPGIWLSSTVPTQIKSPHHVNKQRITLCFVIARNTLLWKAALSGLDKDANVDHLLIFDGRWMKSQEAYSSKNHVFIHGWQSWSYCGALSCHKRQKQPDIALPNFLNAAFHNRERGQRGKMLRKPFKDLGHNCFEGDMFLPVSYASTAELENSQNVKKVDRTVLLGFLSQRKQFGSIRVDSTTGGEEKLTIVCNADGALITPDRTLETDWTCAMHRKFESDEDFVHWHEYLELVAEHCKASVKGAESIGCNDGMPLTWCSWYKFGAKIDTPLLLQQAEVATKKQFQLFLIDDGWSPFWGDWSFKDVVDEKALCSRLKEGSMVPGLWLAPFAADFQSTTTKLNPDFVLCNRLNDYTSPCNSAYPGKFFAGLDATHPDVLYHVEKSLAERAKNFRYFKLDFLYAAVLRDYTGQRHPNNRFDPTKTRAEAMELAMQALRRGAGEGAFLLGCGCPIGSAIGYLDGMRLGCDVGHSWTPSFPLPFWDKTNLPCMRNAVRDALCRSAMNGRWFVGDPDCILLSSPGLTEDEIRSLASVSAVVGGLVSVSDDLLLSKTDDRLEFALRVFPTFNKPFQALDIATSEIPEVFLYREVNNSTERGSYRAWIVLFNWSERRGKQFHILWSNIFGGEVPGLVHLVEHWTSQCKLSPMDVQSIPAFISDVVPYHGVRAYALCGVSHPSKVTSALYLGSDINICGKEMRSSRTEGTKSWFQIETFRPSPQLNHLYFAVPESANAVFKGPNVSKAHRTHARSVYYEVHLIGSGCIEVELCVDS